MPLAERGWNGQACYIVGGGPSLRTFRWPSLLVSGSARVIVINAAYKNVSWADALFTEDVRVVEKFSKDEDWKVFKGVKVFHALDPGYGRKALECDPYIFVIERKRPDKFWARSFSEGLSWSSNSAIGALNVADIMGCDPIYLLGIDCRFEGSKANYHEHYPEDWRMARGQEEVFASDFKWWAAIHLKSKRVVSLINPDFPTSVDCWPKVTWADHFGKAS